MAKEAQGTITINSVQDYLRAVDGMRANLPEGSRFAITSPEGWVLANGQEFEAAPYDADTYGAKGRLKECFANAFHLALARDDLTYCEGYATAASGFPVHHAWCVDADGKVVDPTWRDGNDAVCGFCLGDKTNEREYDDEDRELADDESLGADEDCWSRNGTGEDSYDDRECSYFGVAVPNDLVARIILDVGTYGVLDKPDFYREWEEAH